MGCTTVESGFDYRWCQEIFLQSAATGAEYYPFACPASSGDDHHHLVPQLTVPGAMPEVTPCAFVARYLINHRGNFIAFCSSPRCNKFSKTQVRVPHFYQLPVGGLRVVYGFTLRAGCD